MSPGSWSSCLAILMPVSLIQMYHILFALLNALFDHVKSFGFKQVARSKLWHDMHTHTHIQIVFKQLHLYVVIMKAHIIITIFCVSHQETDGAQPITDIPAPTFWEPATWPWACNFCCTIVVEDNMCEQIFLYWFFFYLWWRHQIIFWKFSQNSMKIFFPLLGFCTYFSWFVHFNIVVHTSTVCMHTSAYILVPF